MKALTWAERMARIEQKRSVAQDREARRDRRLFSNTGSLEAPDDAIADAQRRAAYAGTITEQLCGDPKPGQSALDQKRRQFEKMFLP